MNILNIFQKVHCMDPWASTEKLYFSDPQFKYAWARWDSRMHTRIQPCTTASQLQAPKSGPRAASLGCVLPDKCPILPPSVPHHLPGPCAIRLGLASLLPRHSMPKLGPGPPLCSDPACCLAHRKMAAGEQHLVPPLPRHQILGPPLKVLCAFHSLLTRAVWNGYVLIRFQIWTFWRDSDSFGVSNQCSVLIPTNLFQSFNAVLVIRP